MDDALQMAIKSVSYGKKAFCKFLSANDTGETGGHQAGIYISKPAIPILFDKPCERGYNCERWVKIHWFNYKDTDTRFIYYGSKTRNEYRITNFGKGFPFLKPEYTGSLFVLVQSKESDEDYEAFVLNTEDDINQFLENFNMAPTETNNLITTGNVDLDLQEKKEIYSFISYLKAYFPSSEIMSSKARDIQNVVYNHLEYIISNPDQKLLDWTSMEYKLFRALEHVRYGEAIRNGFENVEDFITLANQVLNRRKSRAGKSLEHHLSAIFDGNAVSYTAQAVTEGRKKPDFIFPSEAAYHDTSFSVEKIISLAAKTTCKDRWRQVLNEADRLRDKNKFLCTMQQGITSAQMDEMQSEKVILVVPKPYIKTYPRDKQDRIWTIKRFIEYVKEKEAE